MTWAKFGTQFADECAEAGLSDAAFRTHVEALMYLYSIEDMDLRIRRHLVRRWAGSEKYQDAVRELVAKKFWSPDGADWRVTHHDLVFRQSLGYQVKERERARKAMEKKRAGEKKDASDVTQEVTDDVTRNELRAQSNKQTSTYKADLIDTETGEVLSLDPWAEGAPRHDCEVCHGPMDLRLWQSGQRTHPTCDPRAA